MIHATYTHDDARILIWKITESEDELYQQLKNEEEKRQFSSLNSEKRRKEFLGVRIALQTLLGREIQIGYTHEGKPYLPDGSYRISISHSREWIAVMVHPVLEVGIDIEIQKQTVLRVYKKFLHETEIARFAGEQDEEKRRIRFQLIWGAKEALYKIVGHDWVDFSAGFQTLPFDLQPEGTLNVIDSKKGRIFALKYFQDKHYCLVFCLAK
ncbi:MAG: 4'-phosphopantetheinyl transferase superfamily protein [Prevotellaceae bacterium]|jgi:phosphopantetheinyl transferase|nr:4'-phosphopantetheinyl transferase superfamily protein [Prevotellaceae bacterium]